MQTLRLGLQLTQLLELLLELQMATTPTSLVAINQTPLGARRRMVTVGKKGPSAERPLQC